MLIEEYVKKFQKLHRERTGENLSSEKAQESFQKLVTLVKLIYQPIRKEDFERIDKK